MKMYEAARTVLMNANRPMHAKEIHTEIVRRNLFHFGAKKPVSVLSQALGDRSESGRRNVEALFIRTAPGTYDLISGPKDNS